ncbi:MAG: hypothetical protein ACRDBM_17280 [Sporomusa sp.]
MFGIIDGLPYLIHEGKAIPVEIKANGDYSHDETKAVKTDVKGVYSVREIIAKCETLSSLSKAKKKTKSKG